MPASATNRARIDRLMPAGVRQIVISVAVHGALFGAVWLAAIIGYALAFAPSIDLRWMLLDVGLVAAGLWLALRKPGGLGFRSLGEHRRTKLLAIAAFAIGCVAISQSLIIDRNFVSLDEANYLRTLREQRIIPDGLLPFNLRWLVPFLAGRWNILPVDDAMALKAINFGGFVVTAYGLVLLLVRLRVPLWLALTAPVFLLCSYFGVYGASNRLVLDASNYALYVLLFHTLLRKHHWPLFAVLLFVASLNAEKALCWMPVFVLVRLLQLGPPWERKTLIAVAKVSLVVVAPTALYFAWLAFTLKAARYEPNLCFENVQNLHLMSFNALGGRVAESLRMNSFQKLWMPFGPFTIYTLLALAFDRRVALKPVVLLLLPIFLQALFACDTDRMMAYAFVVYLPFGFLYLARVAREMPRRLFLPLVSLLLLLSICEFYLIPALARIDRVVPLGNNGFRMALSALEVTLVGALVLAHLTFFVRRPSCEKLPDHDDVA